MLFLWEVHPCPNEVTHVLSPNVLEGKEEAINSPFRLFSPLEEEETSGVRRPAL